MTSPPTALPAILRAEHVAAIFGLASASAARRLMNSGVLGRVFRVGRRLCIRREVFLRAIERLEVDPLVDREPPYWARHLRQGAERPEEP